MDKQSQRTVRQTELTQKDVLDGFAHCQNILFEKIRQITDENQGQPLMIALKTKRVIQKWFAQSGRL